MSNDQAPFRKWYCVMCGHEYDEALGDLQTDIPPGTRFEDLPEDWTCPDCVATKADFELAED